MGVVCVCTSLAVEVDSPSSALHHSLGCHFLLDFGSEAIMQRLGGLE